MSNDNLNNPFSTPSPESSRAPEVQAQTQAPTEAERYEMFLKLAQEFGGTVVSTEGVANPPQEMPQQVADQTSAYQQQQLALKQYHQQAQAAQAAQANVPNNFHQFRQAQAAIPQRNMGNVGAFSVQSNESLIVQNVLSGPLYIADLRLNLQPGEPFDLGYNQDARHSRDLSKCFQYGFIKVLTEEEYYIALQHESYQSMVEDQEREMRIIQKGDLDLILEAEHIDLTGEQGSGRQEFRKATPNMNNPFLRGAQYMQAQAQAQGYASQQQGHVQATGLDPGIYHQQMMTQASSRQGKRLPVNNIYNPFASSSGQATVLQAPQSVGDGTTAHNVQMANYNTSMPRWVSPDPQQVQQAQQFQTTNPFLQQQQQMGYDGSVLAKPIDLANDSYNDNAFGDFEDFSGGPSSISRIGGRA